MNEDKKLKILEEQEANNLVSQSSIIWALVFVLIETLNEFGIYYIDKSVLRCVTLITCVLTGIVVLTNFRCKKKYSPSAKYVVLTMILIQSLVTFTALNFHAVLSLAIPIIIASYYRSKRVVIYSVVITVVMLPVSLVLSLKLGTYDVLFLEFLIGVKDQSLLSETMIESLQANVPGINFSVGGMLFFFGIPNMLTASAAGIMAIHIVKGREMNHHRQIEEVENIQDHVTLSMSELIENRDITTGGHVKRTSDVMRILVDEIRKEDKMHDDNFWKTIIKTSSLHDLGKISIPDEILRKPGRLTEEEYYIIKRHSVKSAVLIEDVFGGIEDEEYIRIAKNIGRFHHEHWDGSGYPEGLKKEEIPYEARIMTYVDVLDALVSKRSYKEAYSFEKAFEIIRQDCGKMFDPNLFESFTRAYPKIIQYYKEN